MKMGAKPFPYSKFGIHFYLTGFATLAWSFCGRRLAEPYGQKCGAWHPARLYAGLSLHVSENMSATGQFVALDPKRFLDYGFELRAPFNQANASRVPTLTFGGSAVNSIGFDLPARQATYFDRAT